MKKPVFRRNCSKNGFRSVWSEWGDSNSRHLAPKASALPTALHPVINFSNCGQTCGQRRLLTNCRRMEKCCQPMCPKDFRVFQGLRSEPRPHAPKCGAVPTPLYPDIQFSSIIARKSCKLKFFLSVVIHVVKAGLVPVSALRENPANTGTARLSSVPPLPVPDTAAPLPKQARYQLRYTRIFGCHPAGGIPKAIRQNGHLIIITHLRRLCKHL